MPWLPAKSHPGVCQIPEGAKLYTAQRFDGYEGVSCMIHSEGNKAQLEVWQIEHLLYKNCHYWTETFNFKGSMWDLRWERMGKVRRVAQQLV